MAKKSNPKLIGVFVVGATVLAVVGALAFGGGSFLKAKSKAVVFFTGQSLAGLDVGAEWQVWVPWGQWPRCERFANA